MSNFIVDIQLACKEPIPVSNKTLKNWVVLALAPHVQRAELTIRIVEPSEMQALNDTYRNQAKVTNVLAFPAVIPANVELDYPLLGDIIICPQVLNEESHTLDTTLEAHWAHIVIHGVLHLLGYDHISETDEQKMRPIEIKLMEMLGYNNPYATKEDTLE